ncbi:MAG TPA: aspartyl protease family protein [Pyrinomonadaceae bacterium]|nr:aspartyl protease family protein [Pyrinomonadaceae bacterium]
MPGMRLPSVSFPAGKSFVEVPFEISGNWMVIPISINGSRPLRFVLDTGAQGTFLQNIEIVESLNLKIVGKMPIRGGGGAGGEASVAEKVTFNIGGIELSNGGLVIYPPPQQGIRRAGNRDGVIGRIVFSTLVVEVDWEKQVLKFYDPAKYKYSGSGTILPLTFDEGERPYTVASVAVSDDKLIPVKLVVDTGGSHTLSLDLGSKPEIKLPAGAVKGVLLGWGAGGEINGSTGQIKKFHLGGQTIENVPTIFPDSDSGITGIGGRQGSLGTGLLRRFKIIYDYSRKQMIIEPNKFFGEPFAVAPTIAATVNTSVSPTSLQEYVGGYGERTISAGDGALYLQRQGGPKIKLVSAGKDEFTIERIPTARIKFVRGESGEVTEIQVLNRDGNWEKVKKETGNLPK